MPQVIQCDAENLTEITSQTCISVIYFDGSWSRKHLHQKNKLLVTLDEKNIDVIYHIVTEDYALDIGIRSLPAIVTFQDSKVINIVYGNDENMASSFKSLYSTHDMTSSCTSIFIAGDSSSVGKTTTCMYLLASLLHCNYLPHELAYIKPVTQCEAEQSISIFCQQVGIACVPIGPVVFYKGFTRSFLANETCTTHQLLEQIESAVNALKMNKKLIIIDGVGYPSVGSICGISNADVAKRLLTPVILIGKSGVGDAIDSYNLNASYFLSRHVYVLGGIFNKLPLEGYYNLQGCKTSILSYFEQYDSKHMPYGFVPNILTTDNHILKSQHIISRESLELFLRHVDISRLLRDVNEYNQLTMLKSIQDRSNVGVSHYSSNNNSGNEMEVDGDGDKDVNRRYEQEKQFNMKRKFRASSSERHEREMKVDGGDGDDDDDDDDDGKRLFDAPTISSYVARGEKAGLREGKDGMSHYAPPSLLGHAYAKSENSSKSYHGTTNVFKKGKVLSREEIEANALQQGAVAGG